MLVNDIYQMSEQVMPDGKARGGFARLAAVIKAERERGNPVIFAHGGDTLSPSMMSGLDRGENIITLTNIVHPDIFVPGNHEFDFGKAVFLQRMKEANFPLFAANLRDKDGQPLPGFRDTEIVTLSGIKVGLVGATYDQIAARVQSGGSEVFSDGGDGQGACGRPAARRGGHRGRRHACDARRRIAARGEWRCRYHPHRSLPRSLCQL